MPQSKCWGRRRSNKKQRRDFLVIPGESSRDWGLVAVVVLLSIGANLPNEWTNVLRIDRRFLLGALIVVVGVALLRYLKFTFILVIGTLIVGANLPADIAREFGVNPQISLLCLVAIILIALSNRLFKLPTGLEKSGRPKTVHGAAALFTAILKGRVAMVQSLLDHGVNANVRTISGKTPLMAAAYKGYNDIVLILLDKDADINAKDRRGDTAEKFAQRGGYTRIVELLKQGRQEGE